MVYVNTNFGAIPMTFLNVKKHSNTMMVTVMDANNCIRVYPAAYVTVTF